jgi:hypothetical protein
MVQHTQIYKYNIAYKQKQRQKSHDHLNKEKTFEKTQHPFMIKVLKKPGIEGMSQHDKGYI